MTSLTITILAAGKGTRMRSKLPKVLQPLAKKPLLGHVINTAKQLSPSKIVTVIGHGAEKVKSAFEGHQIEWIEQTEQLGTGHAVEVALPAVRDEDVVLILYGDVPLISKDTLLDLLDLVDETHPLALLTLNLDSPAGYGRILRDQHLNVQAIVEEKDATVEQKAVKEVNTGIMAVNGQSLRCWIGQLNNDNAQGEYYLTDIIAMAVSEGVHIRTTQPEDEIEVLGVNDKSQLEALERLYQAKLTKGLMQQGATLMDASRVNIRGEVSVAMDVEIDVNVVFEGQVSLGEGVKIGPNCVIKNATIGDGTVIEAFSHIEEAIIGNNAIIGPYARLRPGTELSQDVKIGNFVETKKAKIGKGSKVNHLSYIGDTEMGADCNIGAGTITCNYDGVNKHQTIIGDRVFVGSDTQLVAPVEIGSDATIGAGSTITKPAPEGELTLSRSKQITINGWQKPKRR
jgi:bifunctional UDP-N-acetylglucosamine pyrophosphorylase/glucosamine-1-phosphate N-acetyltransferase